MTRKAQVLILDDEPALAKGLQLLLEPHFECHLCAHIDEAKEIFSVHFEPDIALVDLQLHHELGSNFLYWLKQEHPAVLRVLFSENDDLSFISKALDQELFHRFLSKPLDPQSFPLQMKECFLFAQTLRQSRIDRMTGLLNKMSFHERLKIECDRAKRHQRPLSLVLIDLDHLKEINDLKGHLEGDLWIRRLSQQILNSVRLIDFVGRWGGDEFAILLPDTGTSEAKAVAERLQNSIKDEFTSEVTLSIGISQLQNFETDSARDLFLRTDGALYLAKKKGRNLVEVRE